MTAATSALLLLAAIPGVAAEKVDVTIEIGRHLLKKGGVLAIYPIPTSTEEWGRIDKQETSVIVPVDARFAVVQFRYPRDGDFAYRFRPEGAETPDDKPVQILSVIGSDMQDRGPQMTAGFEGEYSDGGWIVRIIPEDERLGADAIMRSDARWGIVHGNETAPPANARSARSLVAITIHAMQPWPMECTGNTRTQLCTIPAADWPRLEARWWQDIAAERLSRLDFHALRKCYDSAWFSTVKCERDEDADEPEYSPEF